MLGGYAEAQSRICDIRERCVPFNNAVLAGQVSFLYRGIVVEKLVEYMSFKTHYEVVSSGSKEEIPVNDFMERIPPEIVLELSVLILPSFSEDFILINRNHPFLLDF
jgi:elongin-C